MNEDEFLRKLASELPSERMSAVQWAVEENLDPKFRSRLIEAAAHEGVPRIRRAIGVALRRIDDKEAQTQPIENPTDRDADTTVILEELSGIIRHEMQPAIGWVRYSANKELADFDFSATNSAIEALRRRVEGLSSLAAAHRLPQRQQVSLSEIVSACISDEYPSSMFALEFPEEPSDGIFTDPGLLTLILTNAVHNAVDAARELDTSEGQILIATNVGDSRFWITIRNRFLGTTFDYTKISATGRTSKRGHRGLGTRIIELASSRLGYDFDLSASGGTVTFSLRGSRFA